MTVLHAAIASLPTHDIGGYEWECYTSHEHYRGHTCTVETCSAFGQQITDGFVGVDSSGRPDEHDNLVSLDRVLEIIDAIGA